MNGLCRRNYIDIWRGGISGSDLRYYIYIGVCRGNGYENDLCRRNYICISEGCESILCCRKGGDYESDLYHHYYFENYKGVINVNDLCHRIFFGVCRGIFCLSDLYRHIYLYICREIFYISDLSHHNYIDVIK